MSNTQRHMSIMHMTRAYVALPNPCPVVTYVGNLQEPSA